MSSVIANSHDGIAGATMRLHAIDRPDSVS
jgi:hypothetical protein